MAPNIVDVYTTLEATLSTELATETRKGFPDWARSQAVLPVVAVELFGVGNPNVTRVGQSLALVDFVVRVWLFGSSEPELGGLLDGLVSFLNKYAKLDVPGGSVRLSLVNGERHTPETAAQQERHAFWINIMVRNSA